MTDPQGPLSAIESGLRRLGRWRAIRALRPGLAPEETARLLAAAHLESDEALEALYAWHDGTSTANTTLDELHICPGFYFMALDEGLADYAAFVRDDRWSVGWLPILANGGGDFYVIDLATPPGGRVVRHFRIDEQEQPVEFLSLPEMLATFAAAFERSIFFVDDDGSLEMNDDDFAVLARELNPHVEWWR